mmetsp:Transcript_13515/g.45800  ORF Transcript_13515/g.45800 Transcript_13515/m.45800 type:complete len:171 (-) Transcript_13515:217-729(-)
MLPFALVCAFVARDGALGMSAFNPGRSATSRPAVGAARAAARPVMQDVTVDLGEGFGKIIADFQPVFDASEFFVVRYGVPFDLAVEPKDGKVVVTKTDDKLREGDVVRATTTFSMRMDTSFGLLPAAKKTKALFDVTGKDWDAVVEAFTANRKSVTNDVALVVEREKKRD